MQPSQQPSQQSNVSDSSAVSHHNALEPPQASQPNIPNPMEVDRSTKKTHVIQI